METIPTPDPTPVLAPSTRWNLPTAPVDYAAALRGPRLAWWRSLVSLLILAVVCAAGFAVMQLLGAGVALLLGERPDSLVASPPTPLSLAVVDLTLAIGVPATLLAARWAHGVPAGTVHSVVGRFRWGLAGRLLAVLTPVTVLVAVAGMVVSENTRLEVHPQALALTLVVLLTTPLQCAGEEYVFRGWFLQNLGALVPVRWVAWLVPTVLSTVLFAYGHGSPHPLVLVALGSSAVTASVLTWRTGGLEGAVVIHTLNNVQISLVAIYFGDWGAGLVDENTRIGWPDTIWIVMVDVVVLAVALWYCHRIKVATHGVSPRATETVAARPH